MRFALRSLSLVATSLALVGVVGCQEDNEKNVLSTSPISAWPLRHFRLLWKNSPMTKNSALADTTGNRRKSRFGPVFYSLSTRLIVKSDSR